MAKNPQTGEEMDWCGVFGGKSGDLATAIHQARAEIQMLEVQAFDAERGGKPLEATRLRKKVPEWEAHEDALWQESDRCKAMLAQPLAAE